MKIRNTSFGIPAKNTLFMLCEKKNHMEYNEDLICDESLGF